MEDTFLKTQKVRDVFGELSVDKRRLRVEARTRAKTQPSCEEGRTVPECGKVYKLHWSSVKQGGCQPSRLAAARRGTP